MSDVKPDGDGWKGLEAYDRYFYYPDHLVRLPNIPGASDPVGRLGAVAGLVVDALKEPIYEGMPSFIWNMLRGSGEVPSFDDVSIGEEFLRRGGRREPVDNMISAMCHGIYGGDVWKLSAESSIFAAAFMNQRLKYSYSSPWEKWRNPRVPMLAQDHDLLKQAGLNIQVLNWLEHSKEIKSFNFGQGFGVLTNAVVAKLQANPNVKFVNERVTEVRLGATDRMEVCARPWHTTTLRTTYSPFRR